MEFAIVSVTKWCSDEVFTSEGWFKTGDVGTWNPDGTLSIVDRVKNLVKNPYGEYIALEKLEAIYKNSNYVLNACVYASAEVPRVIAIVQPQPNATEGRAEDITKDKQFAADIKKDLVSVGQKNGVCIILCSYTSLILCSVKEI